MENYNPYAEYGYGRWAVILKESGNFIGWCGLKLDQNKKDIGFRFFEEYWGKGFATESAKACLNYGFHHLGFVEIIGRAMKKNIGSIKVLEKIGMKYDSDLDCVDFPGVLYRISKEEFNKI